jgi:hypothetical protein
MEVYCYDQDGWFTGTDWAVESPLELGTGKYLMPGNSTAISPFDRELTRGNGYMWRFVDGAWVEDRRPPETDPRVLRNALLSACDWTQVADVPVDAAKWRVYRQELRDVPQQDGYPWEIIWPETPR